MKTATYRTLAPFLWKLLLLIPFGLFLWSSVPARGSIISGVGGYHFWVPAITSTNAISSPVNAPFFYQITATNHPSSYQAGNLPAGLNFDSSTGLISGTALATGTTQAIIWAGSYLGSGWAYLTITIYDGLTVNIEGQGSVTDGYLGNTFPVSGSDVSIEATPAAGYSFTGWTGGITSSANPLTFTYGDPMILQANFVMDPPVITSDTTAITTRINDSFQYQITASNSAFSFNATGLPSGLSCDFGTGLISGTVASSGSFNVLIQASNAAGTTSSNLVIDSQAALTVSVSGSGSVSSNLLGTTFHEDGETVSITATADPNALFEGWSSDTGFYSISNPLSVSVHDAMAIRASFLSFGSGLTGPTIITGPTAKITVDASPGGTVSPAGVSYYSLLNGWVLLGATPAKGYLFEEWIIKTGSSFDPTVSFGNNRFFPFSGDTDFTAKFVPWSNYAGTYNGLIAGIGAVENNSGALSLKINRLGTFSGSLTLNGSKYPFSGSFDDHFASVRISRMHQPLLYLTLNLDNSGLVPTLTGSLTEYASEAPASLDAQANWSQTVSAELISSFNKETPCPEAGYYTLALYPPDTTATPDGIGYMMLKVSASGAAHMVGILGDGTPFTVSSTVNRRGELPVFTTLYRKAGSLLGTLQFTTSSSGYTFGGDLQWKAPTHLFTLSAVGGSYQSGQALSGTDGSISFSNGNLSNDFSQPFTLNSAGNLVIGQPNLQSVSFKLNKKTGGFSGKFKDGKRTRGYRGVILQQQNLGAGLFVDKIGSGAVQLGMILQVQVPVPVPVPVPVISGTLNNEVPVRND